MLFSKLMLTVGSLWNWVRLHWEYRIKYKCEHAGLNLVCCYLSLAGLHQRQAKLCLSMSV